MIRGIVVRIDFPLQILIIIMKIPFDIKYRPQIESGEYKVVTRDEKEDVDIFFNSNEFVAFIDGKYDWHYDGNGKWQKGKDSDYDLFIITPEPELTEFEEKVKELIGSYPHATRENEGSLIYEVRKAAKELLELAKKEICNVGLDQYWKGREDAIKEYGKSVTYYYPTYPPPCIHGGVCTSSLRDCTICPRTGGTTTSGTCKKD